MSDFETWLEKEHPAHSQWDHETSGEYEGWKSELKSAFEGGRMTWNTDMEAAKEIFPVVLWSPSYCSYPFQGRWWAQDEEWRDDNDYSVVQPTHWQRLPTPPEGDE